VDVCRVNSSSWTSPLSPRQRECFDWYAKGFSQKEVATKMRLSLNTVEKHTKALLRKCSAASMQDLWRRLYLAKVGRPELAKAA
jgi:DNA-binding NarL/FixJ family response regulator